MHSHVEQGSDETVRTGRDKELRIQAKPVPLVHGPESGPNVVPAVLGRKQIAEMNPAAQTPLWVCSPHHYPVGTKGDAIVEAVRVRGVGPSFGFEKRRMKIAPIDADIAVVVRRLKAQTVGAYSATGVRCRLRAR